MRGRGKPSKLAACIGLGLLVLAMILLCFGLAHADTTSKHTNVTGAVIAYENPNIYLQGRVVSGALIESGDKRYLNIRFQPSHTFELYTEEVLLCNAETTIEKFTGKSNPVVLTYERVAHESVQSIGCHVLIGVSEIKPENEVK
jgi:hypothetical protein